MVSGRRPLFTPDQDRFILDMRAKDMTYRWIANRMGYSLQGVRKRWMTLIRADKTLADKTIYEQRSCLMCGNKFNSSWSGNRVCDGCKLSGAWQRDDGRIVKVVRP